MTTTDQNVLDDLRQQAHKTLAFGPTYCVAVEANVLLEILDRLEVAEDQESQQVADLKREIASLERDLEKAEILADRAEMELGAAYSWGEDD